MGAKKGNKNGRGAKGRSGRKSAYQEKADAQFLADMFFKKRNVREIKKIIGKGQFSISDRMILSSMEKSGGQKERLAIFNKLFPDKIKVGEDDGKLPFNPRELE